MKDDQPTQHIPIGYDDQGRPIFSHTPPTPPQPPTPPSPFVQPASQRNTVNSHVTVVPEVHEGNSFDPQLRTQHSNEPRVVHASRPLEPLRRSMSDELKMRHDQSRSEYPFLNLSEGEAVILNISRHPIGLMLPLGAGGVTILALLLVLVFYPADPSAFSLPSFGLATLIVGLVMGLVGIGTYIAVWVYLQNQFFMTNESVIQEIQHGLFSRHEQTVSLGSIEDASFKKNGILQSMFDYGTIRLSTEGEETTYRFHYVSNPRKQVAILNNGIEAFKNGRPVELDISD